MKMKTVAGLAFLLNTFLFATSYAVSKGALQRIDPIVFTFLVMMSLVPLALVMLAFSWQHINREIVKSGFLLGSCLCLGLFTIYVALKYNSATSTAFYPSLNGFVAALAAWLFMRQPIGRITWLAGIVSICGVALLIGNSPIGGIRGAVIAFIGGLICTFYVFLADREQRDKTAYWSLLSIELLTMALWASLVALLFGDWQVVHPDLPRDLWAILYIAFGTIFLPTLITVLLQKHISPVTVSFIYILEPVLGAVVANIYLQEQLSLNGYLGGGLIVAGAVIYTWLQAPQNEAATQHTDVSSSPVSPWARVRVVGARRATTFRTGSILLCFSAGLLILSLVGGFPPLAWRELYHLGPHLSTYLQRENGMLALLLLLAQALCWLIAWGALIVMGGLALYRICERWLFVPATVPGLAPEPQPEMQFTPVLNAIDMRTLRQMGVTPSTISAVRRRGDNQVVERRRRGRRARLARVELVE